MPNTLEAPTLTHHTVFLSASRRNAKIVRDRFQALHPSLCRDHKIMTEIPLPSRMTISQNHRVVLCRGFGGLVGARYYIDTMRRHGAVIVDEWNRPWDL